MFDYRGNGRSEVVPTVEGALLDAKAVRAKLRELARIAIPLLAFCVAYRSTPSGAARASNRSSQSLQFNIRLIGSFLFLAGIRYCGACLFS
jgi:hypothetical protein